MSKKRSEQKECVLVNIMYSGDYLNEKRSSSENIGHEWINLVKPDDPNQPHYVFITKDGKLDHGKYAIRTVLFARAISKEKGNNRVEVIAMATGCKPVDKRDQKKIGKINYGGVPLSKIFERNEYHGEADPFATILATFTAGKVVRVKDGRSIVLYCKKTGEKGLAKVIHCPTSGKTLEVELTKCPNNQALRSYVDITSKKFQKLLSPENRSLWDGEISTLKTAERFDQIPLSSCFANLMGQLHDELSYSNMIAHFLLRHERLRIRFLEWLGNKKSQTTFRKRKVTIEREENHVDLLIRVDGGQKKYMIVIENKIRSSINGKKEHGQDQLDIYAQETLDKCECKTMEEIDTLKKIRRKVSKNSENDDFATEQASPAPTSAKPKTKPTENNDYGRIPWFFLLTPQYNRFEESELQKTIKVVRNGKEEERNVKYTQIVYGDLYRLFSSFYDEEKWETGGIDQVQFKEFLTALKAHDRTTDNINEDMMKERVLDAIARIKKKE